MIGTRRLLQVLSLAAAVAMVAPGCVVRGTGRTTAGANVAYDAPPPPPQEPQANQSRAGFVWISGRYQWQNGAWQWQPGRYERERAGQRWQSGQWVKRGGSYHWTDGQWSAAPTDPGTGTGTVTVNDHRTQGGGTVTVNDHRTQEPAPPPPGYPTTPPPAAPAAPAPRTGYVWVGAGYTWADGQYKWVNGSWKRERPSQVYVPSHWQLNGNYYIFVEGSWTSK